MDVNENSNLGQSNVRTLNFEGCNFIDPLPKHWKVGFFLAKAAITNWSADHNSDVQKSLEEAMYMALLPRYQYYSKDGSEIYRNYRVQGISYEGVLSDVLLGGFIHNSLKSSFLGYTIFDQLPKGSEVRYISHDTLTVISADEYAKQYAELAKTHKWSKGLGSKAESAADYFTQLTAVPDDVYDALQTIYTMPAFTEFNLQKMDYDKLIDALNVIKNADLLPNKDPIAVFYNTYVSVVSISYKLFFGPQKEDKNTGISLDYVEVDLVSMINNKSYKDAFKTWIEANLVTDLIDCYAKFSTNVYNFRMQNNGYEPDPTFFTDFINSLLNAAGRSAYVNYLKEADLDEFFANLEIKATFQYIWMAEPNSRPKGTEVKFDKSLLPLVKINTPLAMNEEFYKGIEQIFSNKHYIHLMDYWHKFYDTFLLTFDDLNGNYFPKVKVRFSVIENMHKAYSFYCATPFSDQTAFFGDLQSGVGQEYLGKSVTDVVFESKKFIYDARKIIAYEKWSDDNVDKDWLQLAKNRFNQYFISCRSVNTNTYVIARTSSIKRLIPPLNIQMDELILKADATRDNEKWLFEEVKFENVDAFDICLGFSDYELSRARNHSVSEGEGYKALLTERYRQLSNNIFVGEALHIVIPPLATASIFYFSSLQAVTRPLTAELCHRKIRVSISDSTKTSNKVHSYKVDQLILPKAFSTVVPIRLIQIPKEVLDGAYDKDKDQYIFDKVIIHNSKYYSAYSKEILCAEVSFKYNDNFFNERGFLVSNDQQDSISWKFYSPFRDMNKKVEKVIAIGTRRFENDYYDPFVSERAVIDPYKRDERNNKPLSDIKVSELVTLPWRLIFGINAFIASKHGNYYQHFNGAWIQCARIILAIKEFFESLNEMGRPADEDVTYVTMTYGELCKQISALAATSANIVDAWNKQPSTYVVPLRSIYEFVTAFNSFTGAVISDEVNPMQNRFNFVHEPLFFGDPSLLFKDKWLERSRSENLQLPPFTISFANPISFVEQADEHLFLKLVNASFNLTLTNALLSFYSETNTNKDLTGKEEYEGADEKIAELLRSLEGDK